MQKLRKPTLSIVMPVYNEEKTIQAILDQVLKVSLPGLIKEIVVVDDGSKDMTRQLLKAYEKKCTIIYQPRNQGKGAAVVTGLKAATGDIFLIQDADLEYSPDNYSSLLQPLLERKRNVVYGSRFLGKKEKIFGKGKTLIPLHYIGNKTLSLFTTLLYFQKITDMETCYKLFTREVYDHILPLQAQRFDLEPEITAKILKQGYHILELPIHFAPRHFSEGKKITWRDGLKALYYLVKYRFMN